MVSIDMNPENIHVRSLDSGREKARAPLAPSSPAAPVQNEGRNPQPALEKRQRRERRKGQRRQHNEPVLLDTRSQRDRRQNADNDTQANAPSVDIYV